MTDIAKTVRELAERLGMDGCATCVASGSGLIVFAAMVRQEMRRVHVIIEGPFVSMHVKGENWEVREGDGTAIDEARVVCECALAVLRDREETT